MQRRTLLKVAVAAIQSVMALVLGLPALRFLLEPLSRKRSPRESGFVRVAPLAALPGGRPLRVTVSADRWDAFTHHPPGPIGSVWIIREPGPNEAPKLRCWQTICPHLGCGIDYSADRAAFACPSHASEFDLSGRRRSGPAPRDMDELAWRITEADEQGRRWVEVRYREFRTGVPQTSPVAEDVLGISDRGPALDRQRCV